MSRLSLTLALMSSFCVTAPDPVLVKQPGPCAMTPPPAKGSWGEARVIDDLGCWTEADVRAIRDELEARRLWDGAVWSCVGEANGP